MKIMFPGIPVGITVVSQERAEKAVFVVCAKADFETPFDDNVETVCCDCDVAIIHRPHAPAAPPKICMECAILRATGGNA
jgi:hypothetical protein